MICPREEENPKEGRYLSSGETIAALKSVKAAHGAIASMRRP
jgi:hypothetical protein